MVGRGERRGDEEMEQANGERGKGKGKGWGRDGIGESDIEEGRKDGRRKNVTGASIRFASKHKEDIRARKVKKRRTLRSCSASRLYTESTRGIVCEEMSVSAVRHTVVLAILASIKRGRVREGKARLQHLEDRTARDCTAGSGAR
jgi:hypothetical protein